ncbi:MAG: nicotinate phosphoribosyltransferase [Bacteroidota bacterium]
MSLALLTDLYQLTMSYGYWKAGMRDHESVFHLFFRKNPFQGGYAIACGLGPVVEFLENFSLEDSDIGYLESLQGNDGKPLFEPEFLQALQQMKFSCDVHAVPEGSVVFPHEPILRIRGPIVLCQLLETPLLNMMNFQTLIATKSSRICQAAQGDSVLEFGLRRAQGIDGGLSASRAAYIGGCSASSNVLAGKKYGIPVRGTHAHSWVMSFDNEMEAFESYAAAMPNNCVFLVDTYNTIQGVKKAIEVGKQLKEKGFEWAGIRLDSGDLADLSHKARQLMNEAGFEDAAIVASNDLDEYRITELKARGAKISVWGVGTRLATAYDQPALGGVYKLAAIRPPAGEWSYMVKLSEQTIKVSNPGIQQVLRLSGEDGFAGDMIVHEGFEERASVFYSFSGPSINSSQYSTEPLLQPIFVAGKRVYDIPSIHKSRAFAQEQLALFADKYVRLNDPASYPVGLEQGLEGLKKQLISQAKEQ